MLVCYVVIVVVASAAFTMSWKHCKQQNSKVGSQRKRQVVLKKELVDSFDVGMLNFSACVALGFHPIKMLTREEKKASKRAEFLSLIEGLPCHIVIF